MHKNKTAFDSHSLLVVFLTGIIILSKSDLVYLGVSFIPLNEFTFFQRRFSSSLVLVKRFGILLTVNPYLSPKSFP